MAEIPKEPFERLKKRREKFFDTIADFARETGFSASSISMHESGERGLSRSAAKYAKALGTFPEWLQYGTGPEDDPSNQERNPMDKVTYLSNSNGRPPANAAATQSQAAQKGRPDGIRIHASEPGPGKGWKMLANHSQIVTSMSELAGVEDPRGYIVMDDEMEPVVINGEILYPHPDKSARARSIVMIWLNAHPDEWRVRELIGRPDASTIIVKRYGTTPVTETIAWDDVARMEVVLRER